MTQNESARNTQVRNTLEVGKLYFKLDGLLDNL